MTIPQRKPSKTLLALATAISLGAWLTRTSQADAGGKPCTAEKFYFESVEQACKDGGRKAATKLMKEATKKAKAAGTKFKCKSCHTSTKTWELTDNAVEDLRKWL